ncbi:unnamed protein product [Phyllotreta striolata]|uniref:Peptidase S1 domain-containing protein n=1 Tax=Phyllotreta striolata TaxID=444603 RepID=A0A9N9TRT2_PHYSR|nr:unnamed protein product [Phyllotreta striolata]
MFIAKIAFIIVAIGFCTGGTIRNYRMEGGTDAAEGQFPFQVSIQFCILGFCEHACGGVIIDKNWILTSAACIGDAQKVVVGQTNLHDNRTLVDVEKTFAHEGFDEDTGISPNDIGLLKLAEPLTFNDTVNVAKLPQQGQTFNGTATLSGYGYSLLPEFNKLQYVSDLNITTFEKCKSAIDAIVSDGDPLDEKSNLCTLNEEANNCDGDAGGPLSQDGVVIGIVTWYFDPCNIKGAPNVYTNVANFVDWINGTISKNQ